MPSFRTVPWESAFKKEFKAAKALKIVLIDIETKICDQAIEISEANHRLWKEYADKAHSDAKFLIELAEKNYETLKSGKASDPEQVVNAIDATRVQLEKMSTALRDTNKEYAESFSGDGYRGDLDTKATNAGVLEKISKTDLERLLKPVATSRQRIISQDITVLSQRKRVDEYCERAKVTAKAALQIFSEEKLHRGEFQKLTKGLHSLFDGATGLDKRIEDFQIKLDDALAAATKGPRSTAELKLGLAETEIPAFGRKLSGEIKTAAVLLQKIKDVYGKKMFTIIELHKATRRVTTAIEQIKKLNATCEVLPRKMRELMQTLPQD